MQTSPRGFERRVDTALWVATFLSGGLTLYMSFGTFIPPGTGAFPGADKLEHAIAYFVTSLLFFLVAVWRPGRGPGAFYRFRWWLVGLVILAGGLVEIGQPLLTADREAEFLDWVSEIAAVLLAFGAVTLLERRGRGARETVPS